MRKHILCLGLALLCLQGSSWAANIPFSVSGSSESPEDFTLELTGSYWLVNTTGKLQSSTSPINFVSDLGIQQGQSNFYGKLVFKPRRKHRVLVEGAPFGLNGSNVLNRSFSYRGQTFSASETVKSTGNLTYVFGGYQYDFISGPTGHLGLNAGATLLSSAGNISMTPNGSSVNRSEAAALPLVGGEFRVFPLRGRTWFDVDGGARGMELGQYGHFAEANLNAGFWLGSFGFEAGYREIDTHLAKANSNTGMYAKIRGPVFSATWRW